MKKSITIGVLALTTVFTLTVVSALADTVTDIYAENISPRILGIDTVSDAHVVGVNVRDQRGTIYFITPEGEKRPYPSIISFISYRSNRWDQVKLANAADLSLPTGSVMEINDGTTVFDLRTRTVYVIKDGQRHGFTSAKVFTDLGHNFSNVVRADTSGIPTGENITAPDTKFSARQLDTTPLQRYNGTTPEDPTKNVTDPNAPVANRTRTGNPALPSIIFTATPENITAGGFSSLSWKATNATSCVFSNSSSTESTTYGILGGMSINPTRTTSYYLVCKGASGQASATVRVTVAPATPAVTCTIDFFTAPPMFLGSPTPTIAWATSNCTSATLSQNTVGEYNPAKRVKLNSDSTIASANTTYTLIAQPGNVFATLPVPAATPAVAAPTVIFTASPENISAGSYSSLNWTAANATSCTLANSLTNRPALYGILGGMNVNPSQTTTYTLICTGNGGQVTKTVTVTLGTTTQSTLALPKLDTLPAGTVGQPYSYQFQATGGTLPYTWDVVGIPAGSVADVYQCCFIGLNQSTGLFSSVNSGNTMPHAGTFLIGVKVIDATGASAQQYYFYTINQASTGSAAPVITFQATPTNITSGSYSALSWSATNATSCVLSNSASAQSTTYGIMGGMNVSPTQNTTYSLVCTGPNGQTTKTVTINVAPAQTSTGPCRITSFTATPQTIIQATSSILSWTTSGCTKVTLTNGRFYLSPQPPNGSVTTGTLTGSTYYVLQAQNANDQSSDGKSVLVSIDNTKPAQVSDKCEITLEAYPTTVDANQLSDITWTTTCTYQYLTGGGYNNSSMTQSGRLQVSPSVTTVYSMSGVLHPIGGGPSTTDFKSVTVTVNGSGPTTPLNTSSGGFDGYAESITPTAVKGWAYDNGLPVDIILTYRDNSDFSKIYTVTGKTTEVRPDVNAALASRFGNITAPTGFTINADVGSVFARGTSITLSSLLYNGHGFKIINPKERTFIY